MTKRMRYDFWLQVVVPCFCSVALLTWNLRGVHADECLPDGAPPFIFITSPAAAGGHHNTEEAVVSLAGKVSDDRGITLVAWSNDRGGTGTALKKREE